MHNDYALQFIHTKDNIAYIYKLIISRAILITCLNNNH